MNRNGPPGDGTGGRSVRTRRTVVGFVCAVLAFAAWLEHRSLRTLREAIAAQSSALADMHADAGRIAALGSAPRRVADATRPNAELLAQVETALRQAGVPVERWRDSVPQAAQPIGDSGYSRIVTRLYFEDVSFEAVTQFAHRLLSADPSLSIAPTRMTAHRGGPGGGWNAELSVAYLIARPESALNARNSGLAGG